jgi:hypothetical protein
MISDPYRSMVPVPHKQVYGLIQAPKPVKEHQCNKPMLSPILRFLLFWLTPIRRGSLWRCAECKEIWYASVDWFPWVSQWHRSDIGAWMMKGGME